MVVSFAGLPVVTSPYLDREPIGPDALADLAARLVLGDLAITALDPVDVAAMTVERTADGYALGLRLPFTSADEVGLQRRDNDLLLTVGEHRRIVTLPSVLRRCDVAGARVRSGDSDGGFRPRPAQWPR